MPGISRRSFVTTSSAAFALASGGVASAATARGWPTIDGGLPANFPRADADAVREIVGKAHVDFDAVKKMVTDRPELSKAVWDWGFGDWESALGAASHMGRRDIAELLIEHGARPNLYTFAMFGQLDVVRATVEANPGIQRQLGPHGITLFQHARRGGDDAAKVVEYLESLGDADEGQRNAALTDGEAAPYVGTYVPAEAPNVSFIVKYHERRKGITFQRDEEQLRFLLSQGNHEFQPGGAPSVTVRFDVTDGVASALSIVEGSRVALTAPRV